MGKAKSTSTGRPRKPRESLIRDRKTGHQVNFVCDEREALFCCSYGGEVGAMGAIQAETMARKLLEWAAWRREKK